MTKLLEGLVMVLFVIAATAKANIGNNNSIAIAKSGCQDRCGNMSIPYPFGLTLGCSFDESFLVTCVDESKSKLTYLGIDVLNISTDGTLRISVKPAFDCYDNSSMRTESYDHWLNLHNFFISHTRNKFTVVGCDATTMIQGFTGGQYATGCIAMCYNLSDVADGSCGGVGCCQTSIPPGIQSYNISVNSYFKHRYVWPFNPCSYAFVAEEGTFNFSTSDLATNNFSDTKFPMILDWTIGNKTCKEMDTKNVCVTQDNSECYDFGEGLLSGYRCRCRKGHQGNPYLAPGCQEIDECADPKLNECAHPKYCVNLLEGYNCSCWRNGTGCSTTVDPQLWNKVAIGTSVGVAAMLICSTWLYWGHQKWKDMKLKEKFFRLNGGLLLQDHLSQCETYSNRTPVIYTAEALKKATNNYDDNNIVGRGGFGTVFKGTFSDGRVVAIKRSRVVDQNQIEQFVNEMKILFQVNHRNVVKLLGCCLETEVPLLVYEYVSNGTLSDHIHNKQFRGAISWEVRLRIAAETAQVLSHLHFGVSTPIVHRDVKSANILLDESYTAKVSDFGSSRSIPLDQAALTTLVQGTIGYLDPEYFQTSQLTEKSDVYSFGIVLLELITGQKVLSFDEPEEKRNLAKVFLCAMGEDRLFDIVDECIEINEDNFEKLEVVEVAKLAKRCIRVKGEERPTMKEVAMELEGLRTIAKRNSWVAKDAEETEYLLGQPFLDIEECRQSRAGNSSSGYDSMRNHITLSNNDGR